MDPVDAQSEVLYDRAKELQEFDSTKAGVKGLVDAGLEKIPKIFIHPTNDRANPSDTAVCFNLQIPVIDLKGIHEDRRREEVVAQVLDASSRWGFFQIVNHGIPDEVLDEMIEGIGQFNEQPKEAKMEFYTRDINRKVHLQTNYDLFKSVAANWRDTLTADFDAEQFDPQELPQVCRDIMMDYKCRIKELGETLSELLSEALGLPLHRLKETKGFESLAMVGHYYPPCPQPHLTLGTGKHTDPSFLTILLQDQIGGLQVLHQDHWVDVNPIPGALIVNIGDLLQLVTNGKYKSVNHRVLATKVRPRVSVAIFIQPHRTERQLYGPLKELLSDDNPPRYQDVMTGEFLAHFSSRALDECTLDKYKL